MPRDQRLYMTFPNDFHRHPKLARLPVEARWAFVEMNGEARIADNDGVFAADEAEFLWPREVLDALVASHPSRPLVVREDDTYVIRDYAEHQETREAREKRRATNAANGAKGGRPRKNPVGTEPKPSGFRMGTGSQPNGTHTKAESESKSESEIDVTLTTESSHVVDAHDVTDSGLSPVMKSLAAQAGILDVEAIQARILERTSRDVPADQTVTVARHLLAKAKDPTGLRSPQKYVIRCINLSPAEVQQYIDENGLAA